MRIKTPQSLLSIQFLPLYFVFCLVILPFDLANAEDLLSVKVAGEELVVSLDSAGGVSLKISGAITSGIEAFHVENPDRIVVDIPGIKERKNYSYGLTKGLLKSLRIGSHPEKLRLVLDLRSPGVPTFNFDPGPPFTLNVTSVAERPADSTAAPQSSPAIPAVIASQQPSTTASVQPSQSPTPKPSPATKPTPTNSAAPSATPKKIESTTEPTASPSLTLPSLAPTEKSTDTPAPSPSSTSSAKPSASFTPSSSSVSTPTPAKDAAIAPEQQALSEITFDFELRGGAKVPTVKIVLNKRSDFQLKKNSERGYLITIPDCKVTSRHNGLPYFPPHDFIGFSVLLAEQKGSAAEVSVGTELGIRLAYAAKGNEIWLQTANK